MCYFKINKKPMYYLELTSENKKGFLILYAKGMISVITMSKFEEKVHYVLREREDIIFDFEGVNYISTAGLIGLISLNDRLKEQNRDLLISGLQGFVKNIFEITNLIKYLKTYESIDRAIEEFDSINIDGNDFEKNINQ